MHGFYKFYHNLGLCVSNVILLECSSVVWTHKIDKLHNVMYNKSSNTFFVLTSLKKDVFA